MYKHTPKQQNLIILRLYQQESHLCNCGLSSIHALMCMQVNCCLSTTENHEYIIGIDNKRLFGGGG
jgi:hypothetical protein